MKSLVAKGVGTNVKEADPVLPFHELKLWEEGVVLLYIYIKLKCH
jgi:hypothetical protein